MKGGYTYARKKEATLIGKIMDGNRQIIVQKFIQENIHRRITLNNMAQAAALSTHHFCRCYASTFGMPPMRHLLLQRLERAREMLETTEASMTDIAISCGFSSQSHFSASFRAHNGVSPTTHRRAKNSGA